MKSCFLSQTKYLSKVTNFEWVFSVIQKLQLCDNWIDVNFNLEISDELTVEAKVYWNYSPWL